MAKAFHQALKDGWYHVMDSITPDRMKQLRREHVLVDEEGYYSFIFGDHKEFEVTVEPRQEEHQYQIAIYKHGIAINEKLLVWTQP